MGSSHKLFSTPSIGRLWENAVTLDILRWITVVVPLVFLVSMDYLRHFVFPELLHPFSGYLIVLLVVTLAVLFFSQVVFDVIKRMQARILDQNQRLAEMGETARSQAAQLRALHEAGLALSSDLAPEAVLLRGVDLARELAGARYGALAIQGEGGIAHFLTSGLSHDERSRLHESPRGRGLLGAVLSEGRPIRVGDIPSDPRAAGFPPRHPAMTTFLGVPIIAKGRILGGLYLTDKITPNGVVPFSTEDEDLLQLFATQAAVAIENAKLHSKVESLAATAERERIAREMHDSLAQALGYIGVRSQAAQDALAAGSLDQVDVALDRIRVASETAYADVREAILGLRSGMRTNRTLAQSLREYIERYRLQSSIKIELEVVGSAEELQLAPAAEVQLLRIIQEAMANIRKHAGAQKASVRLEHAEPTEVGTVLRATVEDNGHGFDLSSASMGIGGYGLSTMRERAEAAGGHLRVETAPGRGTRVVVDLPTLGLPARLAG